MSPFYVRRKRRRVVSIPRAFRKFDVIHLQAQGNLTVAGGNPAGSYGIIRSVIIPSVDVPGVRKVKNFTIQIACGLNYFSGNQENLTYFYLLFYVPQGIDPQNLVIPIGTPGQLNGFIDNDANVILSGSGSTSDLLIRTTSLSRNLNSGDSVALVIQSQMTTANNQTLSSIVDFAVSYALCYN